MERIKIGIDYETKNNIYAETEREHEAMNIAISLLNVMDKYESFNGAINSEVFNSIALAFNGIVINHRGETTDKTERAINTKRIKTI